MIVAGSTMYFLSSEYRPISIHNHRKFLTKSGCNSILINTQLYTKLHDKHQHPIAKELVAFLAQNPTHTADFIAKDDSRCLYSTHQFQILIS